MTRYHGITMYIMGMLQSMINDLSDVSGLAELQNGQLAFLAWAYKLLFTLFIMKWSPNNGVQIIIYPKQKVNASKSTK